ncbi:MAG TPA: TolC family protein [Vicinamibacterales bacterium]|jgi:outer membrane protein TolC
MMRPRQAALLGTIIALAIVPAAHAQQAITLKQAIEMAQSKGPLARAATAQREAARQRDRAFNARLRPQISLTGSVPSYQRAITPVLQPDGTTLYTPLQQTSSSLGLTMTQQLPLTGGQLSIGSSLSQLQLSGSQQYKSYTTVPYQISLQQPLFRPNETRWNDQEQALNIDISETQYLEARENIAIATTNAFFAFYSARINLNNSVANAAVNDTLYTLNKGRFEVGKIGENDLLQSELALLRARAAVDQARLDFDRTLSALRIAVSVAPSAPLDVTVTPDVPDFQVDTLLAVRQALHNQSQVRLNEFSDVDANRRVAEAKLSGGPGASVTASYGVNQTAGVLNQAYQSPLESQAFALSLSTPVFLFGAHSADVQAAQASREAVQSNNKLSVANIEQGARFAALGFEQAQRGLSISAKADTVGSKRYEVAYNRYVIGKINYADLYIAQQEKDAALQAFVAALQQYWLSYYQLRLLTLYDFEKGAPIR